VSEQQSRFWQPPHRWHRSSITSTG
jgi:hypothetical protein